MIKNLSNKWDDIFDVGKTINKNILTVESAIEYITEEYGNTLGNFATEYSDSEIYVTSENIISCVNCGN
jgi:hypothetical protein